MSIRTVTTRWNVGRFTVALMLVSGALASTIHSASDVPRRLRYHVGKTYQYDYRVAIDTTSASRDSGGVHAGDAATTVVDATANVTMAGVDGNGSYVGELALQNPSVQRTLGGTTYALDDLEMLRALEVPLRFTQAPNGRITGVSSAADVPAHVVNIQKGVLNALQVTLLPGGSYVAAESAGQGTIQARYTLEERSGQLRINKQYDEKSLGGLVSSGAPIGSLKLRNQIGMVLDYSTGVLSSVTYEETLSTGDGAATPTAASSGFDGVTAWTTLKTTGSLKLRRVVNATGKAAKARAYQADSLQANVSASSSKRSDIDLKTVDLTGELGRFEREPGHPALHARLVALIAADSDATDAVDVIAAVADRLVASAANDAVASAYVDVLGSVGSPVAQDLLSAVLGRTQAHSAFGGVTFGAGVQQQALFSIVRVQAPTLATLDTVTSLSARAGALRETSTTVLGAVAGRLAAGSNPAAARAVVERLESSLLAADNAIEIELYLNALGNAGLPSSFDAISRYATPQGGASDAVQAAALTALRKIPGKEAESLLQDAMGDLSRPAALRELASGVVTARISGDPLMTGALAALPETEPGDEPLPLPRPTPTPTPTPSPTPPPVFGMYNQSWTYRLGNTDLGVDFPGGIKFDVPPSSTTGINAYAFQQANALIYGFTLEVAKGELRSFREGNYQVFGAYLSIANNLIRHKVEQRFQCADQRGGNLYQATVQFLDFTTKLPVFALITFDLNVKASGNFSLDWNFGVDMCRLNYATVQAGIVPRAWVSAQASAYLDVPLLARGGLTLTANLLNTAIPAQAAIVWDATPATPGVRFCVDIKATTQPLSGHLDAWVEALGFERQTARLWDFSTPTASYPLLVQCF